MTFAYKSRLIDKFDLTHHEKSWRTADNFVLGEVDLAKTVHVWQVTGSEGHRWPKDRGVRDAGGPFETVKFRADISDRTWVNNPRAPGGIGSECEAWGNAGMHSLSQIPAPFLQSSPEEAINEYRLWLPGSTTNQLQMAGTKFIADTIPTNPIVDGSVSMAELYREGLPSMIGATMTMKNKIDFFRSLGSEYLSVEFGWKPFLSDLDNATRAIFESAKIIKNLVEHSGKDLKRFRMYPPTVTQTYQMLSSTPTATSAGMWSTAPQRASLDRKYTRQWFSGCYTFYFEPSKMDEIERIVTQARLLYGIQLTPEVLWNLAPWSWLIDWVANVGDVLHNISAFQQDGLVMKYGYVMEYSNRRINTSWFGGNLRSSFTYPTRPLTSSFEITRKQRIQATPYGFGLSSTAFSSRQWAILIALGFARAPQSAP